MHTDCKHLQSDNRCGIYDTRPQICRDYSTDDCEYEDDWVYEQYLETAEQVDEYAEAVLPPQDADRASAAREPPLLPVAGVVSECPQRCRRLASASNDVKRIEPRTLKGFRDYLPEAMIPREWLIDTARRVYRSYGFSPIDTPALEYLEILTGKGSDETDKQLYQFRGPRRPLGRACGST